LGEGGNSRGKGVGVVGSRHLESSILGAGGGRAVNEFLENRLVTKKENNLWGAFGGCRKKKRTFLTLLPLRLTLEADYLKERRCIIGPGAQ